LRRPTSYSFLVPEIASPQSTKALIKEALIVPLAESEPFTFSTIAVANGSFLLPAPVYNGLSINSNGKSVCVVCWATNRVMVESSIDMFTWREEVEMSEEITVWVDIDPIDHRRVYRFRYLP
jgi:hypothetical protein